MGAFACTGTMRMADKLCIVCDLRPQRRNRRCDACSQHLRSHGYDRPISQVHKHGTTPRGRRKAIMELITRELRSRGMTADEIAAYIARVTQATR